MSRTTFTREIATKASRYGLDPDLVEALVLKESGGHQYAFNPEPNYRYLWNVRTRQPFRKLTLEELARRVPPADFPTLAGDPDQEWVSQSSSWGLMQVMGGVARELGFMGDYIGEIYEVEINLDLGCKLLARLLRRADGGEALALGAYNAGWGGATSDTGIKYAGRVLRIRAELDRT